MFASISATIGVTISEWGDIAPVLKHSDLGCRVCVSNYCSLLHVVTCSMGEIFERNNFAHGSEGKTQVDYCMCYSKLDARKAWQYSLPRPCCIRHTCLGQL